MPDLTLIAEPLRDWAQLAAALALPMLLLAVVVYRRHGALFPPPAPDLPPPAPEPEVFPDDAIQTRLPDPSPAPPWLGPAFNVPLHGGEVMAGFLLATFIVTLAATLLRDAGALALLTGAGAPDQKTEALRLGLWSAVLALPFQVAAIFFLLRRLPPAQFGWTAQRLGQNILAGFVYWLLLMPGVLWFNILVGRWYERVSETEPEQHAIQKLVESAATRPDWVLAVLTAAVAAPIVEELLYRGLLQTWVTRDGRRGDIVLTLTLFFALAFRGDGLIQAAQARDANGFLLELQPAAMVVCVLPIYAVLRWRGQNVASGIGAGALLFAMVHAGVWPSPVPLLPLGLTLGWLAWRTQSLVGPIVLHALFNSVALLGLFHHEAPPNGNAVTSTLCRPLAVSASTTVPGASLPRRK